MREIQNKTIVLLWFLLSWSVLLILLINPILNQLVLKILIPLIFFILLYLERGKFNFNISLVIFIIFTIYASISVFYTINMEMTLGYLQILAGNILVWYLTFRLMSNFYNKNTFLFILGTVFVIHAVLGLLISPVNEYSIRMQGIYSNPNGLGFAMWDGIIIFIYFFLINRTKQQRILIIFVLIFLIWILIFTASRKSLVASLVSIAVVLFYLSKINFKRLLFITPFVIFGYIFVGNFIMKETPLGVRLDSDYVEKSANFRAELISEGFKFFIEHPFLGIGLGSFTSYSSSGKMSHNDYIEILSSMGMIGFLIYISIFWLFYRQSKILLKFSETYYWGVISRAFLFGYLILGMGRPAFLDPAAILVFASFQGMVQLERNRIILQKQLEN